MINNNHITTFDSLLSFITEEDDDMSDMFDTMIDMFSDKPVYYLSHENGTTNIEAVVMHTAELYKKVQEILQTDAHANMYKFTNPNKPGRWPNFKEISTDTRLQDMMKFLAVGDIILMGVSDGYTIYDISYCQDKDKLKKYFIMHQERLMRRHYNDNESQNSINIIYQKYIDKLNALP